MANSVNPSALTTKDTKVHEGNPHGDSRRKMEMYVVPGSDWRAVERGRLVVPAAQGGLDLFVDPVTDRLHNFGFDDVALGVDRDFDDDVALQVPGKLGAGHRRIWIHDRISDMDFMAGDRSVNHGAERRTSTGVVVGGLRVSNYIDLLRLWRGLWRLGLRAYLARPGQGQQLSRVSGNGIVPGGRWKVSQFVGMGSVSIGKPIRAQLDHPGIMEHEHGQHRQVRGHRHNHRTMASESRTHGLKTRGLKTGEHAFTTLPD